MYKLIIESYKIILHHITSPKFIKHLIEDWRKN